MKTPDPADNPRHCARALAVLPDGSGSFWSDWQLPGGAIEFLAS